MVFLTYFFFIISIVFFLGMVFNIIAAHRPGIFPMKVTLRQRAGFMAVGTVVFLLIAFVFSLFK